MAWKDKKVKNGKAIGVIIGRFEPFHNGHLSLIDVAVYYNVDKLIILVGSSNAPLTFKNPFDFNTRKHMIEGTLMKLPIHIEIHPIYDKWNDNKWRNQIHEIINSVSEKDDEIYLFGYEKDSTSYYLKTFPNWTYVQAEKKLDVNATDIRNQLFERMTYNESDISVFTKSILKTFVQTDLYKQLAEEYFFMKKYREPFDALPYDVVFTTVDAIIYYKNKVLMVKRKHKPSEGYWSLIGGFVKKDERLRQSLNRIVKDKIGLDISEVKESGFFVEDNPNRSLRGRTITNCFYFELSTYYYEIIKESENVKWVLTSDLPHLQHNTFEDHGLLINRALEL